MPICAICAANPTMLCQRGSVAANRGTAYCCDMAGSYREYRRSPTARVPQLLVSIGCSISAFTGVWLWWFGQDISNRVGISNSFTDPFAAQAWMRRLHWGASIGVCIVIGFMTLRAVVARHGGWRVFFLVLFLVLLGIGLWSGYEADWNQARMWSETVGSKFGIGINLGDRPSLPPGLRDARVHVAIVPAALAIVALASFYNYRQS